MLSKRIVDDQIKLQTQARTDRSELAERRMLDQIAARQLPAFDALYRCYHPRLARFLDRMTRSPSLIDAVLNDTMLVVWNRAESYNGQCSRAIATP